MHLKSHGINSKEYKEMFPGEKLVEYSEETKEKLRQGRMNKPFTKEQKENLSNVMKGKTKSDEHKQALREAKAKEDKKHRAKVNGDNRRGSHHTRETIEHIAKTSNQKHPFRGKSGIREDIGHFVRSTWEANFARILRHLGWKYEYEPEIFWLKRKDGSEISYTPDFKVGNTYIEIKGYWLGDAREKFDLFREQYPNLKVKIIDGNKYNLYKARFAKLIKGWE
jgi:hypothetical protein